MFEFIMNYREPGFHQENDPDFLFPPMGVPSKIDSNLIEVRGKNGTGKSTFLNALALSFGYIKNAELKTKPITRDKMDRLDANDSLNYSFHIERMLDAPIDIKLTRSPKKKISFILNGQEVKSGLLSDFEVIYLTEDDPDKVVNIILRKLLDYYYFIEQQLLTVSNLVSENQRKVTQYKNYQSAVEQINSELEINRGVLAEYESELRKLKLVKNQVIERDETKIKMELLKNEEQIIEKRNYLKNRVERIDNKSIKEVRDKIYSLENKINGNNRQLTIIERDVGNICNKFKGNNIIIDVDKILACDYSEIDKIERSISTYIPTQTQNQLKLLDDMIKVFEKYPMQETIPVLNMRVSDMLEDLRTTRARYSIDNLAPQIKELKEYVKKREKILNDNVNLSKQIEELKNELGQSDDVVKLHKDYDEANELYIKLQKALDEGKNNIINNWEKSKNIEGNSEEIEISINDKEKEIKRLTQLIYRDEGRIQSLHENNKSPPKYHDKLTGLEALYDKINKLRIKTGYWIRIINDPRVTKESLAREKREATFTNHEYQQFAQSLGRYIGQQFKPFKFAGSTYDINFYDLENKQFITSDNRQIYAIDLSRGQSKIVSLQASLQRLKDGKKGIVLIDEIADLDAENLQEIKQTLKKYYESGNIVLSVLVRPMSELSKNTLEITGWS